MNWKSVETFFENNIWVIFFALLGYLLTIYTYFKSKKKKVGVFNLKSVNLVSSATSKLSKLEVFFNGKKIDNVTSSYIAIWNRGNDIISKEDVAPADPLKLKFLGELLEFTVIREKNRANNFRLKLENSNELLIEFDYMAKNEGILIKAEHTGNSNSDIQVLGTIKGVGSLKPGYIEVADKAYDFFMAWLRRYYLKDSIKKGKPSRLFRALMIAMIFVIMPILLPLIIMDIIRKSFIYKTPNEFQFFEDFIY